MDLQCLLSLFVHFLIQIILIPPTLGNEMGKSHGDAKYPSGNKFISYKGNISSIFIFFAMSVIHNYMYHDLPLEFLGIVGVFSCVMGTIVCLYSYMELGNYYTHEIGIRKDHRLVTTGPYHYLAHPGYFGQFLVTFGATLFWWTKWYIQIFMIVYLVFRFYNRIISEEVMLLEHFGNKYREYLKKRWRLIPFVV